MNHLYLSILIVCISTAAHAGECYVETPAEPGYREQVKTLIAKYESQNQTGRQAKIVKISQHKVSPVLSFKSISQNTLPCISLSTHKVHKPRTTYSKIKNDGTTKFITKSIEEQLYGAIAENNSQKVRRLLEAGARTSVQASEQLKLCTDSKIMDLMVQACVKECGDLFKVQV